MQTPGGDNQTRSRMSDEDMKYLQKKSNEMNKKIHGTVQKLNFTKNPAFDNLTRRNGKVLPPDKIVSNINDRIELLTSSIDGASESNVQSTLDKIENLVTKKNIIIDEQLKMLSQEKSVDIVAWREKREKMLSLLEERNALSELKFESIKDWQQWQSEEDKPRSSKCEDMCVMQLRL